MAVDCSAQLVKTLQQKLHQKTCRNVQKLHGKSKQNFYGLVMQLLTLLITSASCELDELDQSWTWIGFIHGLDWIGSEVFFDKFVM